MRLWIDTDVGANPDDAVALLCAAAHPEVELVGVSTVDGDTASRTRLARELVDAPVIDGAALTAAPLEDADPEALLAIGPLTNVAALLAAGYPAPRIAVMGGTHVPVEHRGARRTVEHNFGADPAAATTVLRATRVLLCPLNMTLHMALNAEEVTRLAATDRRLQRELEGWARREPGASVCLHDPLALLALIGEPIVQVERCALAVASDGRLREGDSDADHDVVVEVDAGAAKTRIFELLEDGGR